MNQSKKNYMEKGFNYREYLAEGWLFKEDKRKRILEEAIRDSRNDSYEQKQLKRKVRQHEGNWEGSIGEFFENYCDTLGSEYQAGTLRQFCEDVMIPNLGPSAQEDCRELMDTCKSDERLLDAFKNFYLAGIGMPAERAHGLRRFKMPKKNLKEISSQTALNAASLAADRGQDVRSDRFRRYAMNNANVKDDTIAKVSKEGIVYWVSDSETVAIFNTGRIIAGRRAYDVSSPGPVCKVENRKVARLIANWCAKNLNDGVAGKEEASDWHYWAAL